MRNIILASQSPRRRELMEQAGFKFEIIPSHADEVITCSEPSQVVRELSMQKAKDVYFSCIKKSEDILVIGADTVVSVCGRILGKPVSEDDAKDMIRLLQGNTHQVYTGVSLAWQEKGADYFISFSECTRVTCYPMTEKEIENYVACGEPMDKAGAYGIQGHFGVYVKEICGDYNNVVGLPIARLYHELIKCGLTEI